MWCIVACLASTANIAQVKVASLSVTGNAALSSTELLQHFELQPNSLFEKEILEQDLHALLSRYETIGYPFARVSIEAITPAQATDSMSIDIHLNVVEGQFVKINQIKPAGNKETLDDVIIRETGIRLGEEYNIDRVAKIRNRLNRLNIFSQVGDPELTMNDSGGVLTIPVMEGNTNTFDGVLGYIPATNGNDGYFTGLVNISMRNLFGSARKLNVLWQREGTNIQEIALRYNEPWLFNYPVDLEGSFRQRQQDTTYVRRGYILKVDFHLFDEFFLAGIFSYESIIPANSLTGVSLRSTQTTTTGLELRYDSRNDMISPTNGVLYRSEYQIGKKTESSQVTSATSSTVQKLELDAVWLVQPFTRQVVSLELHGRERSSDNIGIGELYRLGGSTTLRGYRENQFLGSRIGWTNLEYRFLFSRRSFFFGFFDTGYYFLPDNQSQGLSSAQAFNYGYGIGTRIETAIGIVGVSFALGEGDSFNQGKIHFGLVNEF